jgi:hypothetical protein
MEQPPAHYARLKQWLLDNPLKAIDIAHGAIWGLYSTREGKLEDPEEENPVSGADYIDYMTSIMAGEGVEEMLDVIRSDEADQKIPEVTHWLVNGRIPGEDAVTTHYLLVSPDSTPVYEYVKRMYGGSVPQGYIDERLPDPSENIYGSWIVINSEHQIAGPPIEEHVNYG